MFVCLISVSLASQRKGGCMQSMSSCMHHEYIRAVAGTQHAVSAAAAAATAELLRNTRALS